MRIVMSTLLLGLLAVISHPGFAGAPEDPLPDLGGQIDEIFAPWDTAWTPGVAVAAVKGGEILYSNGYGYAQMEYDVKISPSTVFHIASISKQFTTFSVLLLEQEGKLSLDDDIRKHIPEMPDFGEVLTLRQMAHNISGIRDQWNLLGMAGWRLDDIIRTDQVLRLIARQQELNFQPGEEYLYSNTGFTLLAEVVARVSGQSFPEFTRERIFEPLGMNNTLFYDNPEVIVRNRAYSYGKRDEEYRKRILSYATAGATSLFTTVEDLALWAGNFDHPVVGDRGVIEKMDTRGVLNDGSQIDYALGQTVGTYRGLEMISHGGADAGYRAFFARFPEHEAAVIVFSNDAGFNSRGMATQVADVLLADYLEEEVEEEEEKEIEAVAVDIDLLQTYTGQYVLRPDNYAIITLDEDTLHYHTSASGRKRELTPVSEREFVIGQGPGRIVFKTNEDEKAKAIKMVQNQDTIVAERTEPFDPSVVDLDQYTGTFYSEELDITYTLEVEVPDNEDDEPPYLKATQLRIGEIRLRPLTPDHFGGSAWFASRIRFIRDDENRVTGMRISGSRARDVWFEKI